MRAVVDAVKAMDSKLNGDDKEKLRSRDSTAHGRDGGDYQQRGHWSTREGNHSGNEDEIKDGTRLSKKRRRSSRDEQSEDEDEHEGGNRRCGVKHEDPARKAARAAMWAKRRPFFAPRRHPDSGQIFVKSLTGTTDTYEAPPGTTTVGELMGMITRRTGLPPENQRLVFAGIGVTPGPEDDHWEEHATRTLGSVSALSMYV